MEPFNLMEPGNNQTRLRWLNPKGEFLQATSRSPLVCGRIAKSRRIFFCKGSTVTVFSHIHRWYCSRILERPHPDNLAMPPIYDAKRKPRVAIVGLQSGKQTTTQTDWEIVEFFIDKIIQKRSERKCCLQGKLHRMKSWEEIKVQPLETQESPPGKVKSWRRSLVSRGMNKGRKNKATGIR